jgi:hypothetical protein
MAPDPASRPGRVPVLPRVPWFSMGHGTQIYKEMPSWLTYAEHACMFLRHACMFQCSRIFKTRMHVPKAPDFRVIMGLQDVWIGGIIITCKMCGQCATVQLNIVAPRSWPRTSTTGRRCTAAHVQRGKNDGMGRTPPTWHHHLPTPTYKALAVIIGRQLPRGHLSGPGFACKLLDPVL